MEEWSEFSEQAAKIEELIDIGLLDEALALLDQFSIMEHDDPDLLQLYARVYSEKSLHEKAVFYLEKALPLDRTNLETLLGLFYSHAQLRHLKKAQRYLRLARKYHPDDELVLNSLMWFHSESGEYKKALDLFERESSRSFENPEIYQNAGIAYQRNGNAGKAEQCFIAALTLNPHSDESRDMLSDLYILEGKVEKSIALFEEYLRTSPHNIRALSRLVFCLCQANRIEQARSTADAIVSHYPNSAVGYVDRAYVDLAAGLFDEALIWARKALDVDPLDAEAVRIKGIIYSEKEQDQEAEKAFHAAMQLEPENPEIMRDFYHHLRATGQTRQMEKLVHAVIEMEYPYCMEDYWFLADYFREEHRNLEAFHYLCKAYRLMPGEIDLIPPMAYILLEKGHLSYSTTFLLQYVQKNGWNSVMKEFVGHRKLRSLRSQEGFRLLRFFGEKTPDFRRYLYLYHLRRYALFLGIPLFAGLGTFLGLGIGWPAALLVLFSIAVLILGTILLLRRQAARAARLLLNVPDTSPKGGTS